MFASLGASRLTFHGLEMWTVGSRIRQIRILLIKSELRKFSRIYSQRFSRLRNLGPRFSDVAEFCRVPSGFRSFSLIFAIPTLDRRSDHFAGMICHLGAPNLTSHGLEMWRRRSRIRRIQILFSKSELRNSPGFTAKGFRGSETFSPVFQISRKFASHLGDSVHFG